MKNHQRVYASVDLKAIAENLKNIGDNLRGGVKMIAVVKADAYGHGAIRVSGAIEGEPRLWGFAVSNAAEAVELRAGGISKPILILGHTFPEDYEMIIGKNIVQTIFTLASAKELSRAAISAGQAVPVHLAVDSGMTRIGFRGARESLPDIIEVSRMPNLRVEGIFTHFARADEEDIAFTKKQMAEFRSFLHTVEGAGIKIPMRHCNNSAGSLWNRDGDFEAVRPGIALYGVYPSDETDDGGVALRPAMEIKSRISHLKEVEAGVPVSYGGTFVTVREKTLVATIPVGYADGYPRSLSNRGETLIRGRRAKIIGRICMDQLMVDATDIPGVSQGDAVTLLGRDGEEYIPVEELSALSGRFPYEFLCCVGRRVPRIYL
ncbi:MAG: alanine racemase [Synergistaceae bacterium]|nr:alanine racemase [Synergistaceae bacterium]